MRLLARRTVEFLILFDLVYGIVCAVGWADHIRRADLTPWQSRHWAEFVYGHAYGYGETRGWRDVVALSELAPVRAGGEE